MHKFNDSLDNWRIYKRFSDCLNMFYLPMIRTFYTLYSMLSINLTKANFMMLSKSNTFVTPRIYIDNHLNNNIRFFVDNRTTWKEQFQYSIQVKFNIFHWLLLWTTRKHSTDIQIFVIKRVIRNVTQSEYLEITNE